MRNFLCCCALLVFSANTVIAQNKLTDPSVQFTLDQCIEYALKNQPTVHQAQIDESIAHTNNRIALSSWLPQISLNTAANHYFKLPTAFIPNVQMPGSDKVQTSTGLLNTVIPNFQASQTLFNNEVLTALRASPLYNKAAKQNTEYTKINIITNVSIAFYDVLLSQAQIIVLSEDTTRLSKNLHDAYSQYVAGIVDKVDYKRATISLNNSVAELKNAGESVTAKLAVLRQQIGYDGNGRMTLVADTAAMMQDIITDTSASLDYSQRIEFQQLYTAQLLQRETTHYYATGFLPSVSAFYSYVPEFENDKVSTLFGNSYPYSLFGINLSLPIFQGFKRIENIHKSRLQEERLHWEKINLQLQINSEYNNALTDYKSNLNSFTAMKANVALAREVYDVIRLQYREGIKQYLEVITAEADLRSSEINYLNALYQLLASKVTLQKSLGNIHSTI